MSSHLHVPFPPAAPPALRLPAVSANHPAARRYSRARRRLLPREERVTTVHGTWAHRAVLAAGAPIEALLWCPGDDHPDRPDGLAADCAGAARAAYRISERTLARLHPGVASPALLSVVALPRASAHDVLGPGAGLVLVADGIEYAGNLGTLIRTADACGADGVLLTGVDARLTHPLVFGASRGTVLTMPVVEYAAVDEARRDLAAAGFTAYVADPAAAVPYREAGLGAGPTAVVVGSEGRGVREGWRTGDLCRVAIPMRGRADSLNVATSAAVLLFEARARLDDPRA